ncbi:MAG: hypothetical protein ACYCST_10640 [Acidimicrobiales bacterium]
MIVTGALLPTVSNLNFTTKGVRAYNVTVPVGTNGQIEVYNHTGTVELGVDIDGYYTAAGGTGSIVSGGRSGYATIYPVSDTAPPLASDINWTTNEVVPNFATADAAASGKAGGPILSRDSGAPEG